ncbi:hypothetical protein FRC03_007991 [Tulasnella sp. 419]|nr:hypothetical protein FRC03_007991 [Tulasnella sp. 419]
MDDAHENGDAMVVDAALAVDHSSNNGTPTYIPTENGMEDVKMESTAGTYTSKYVKRRSTF